MNYSAIIEIPTGSDRRIHMSYDMSGFIDLGPIKEQIPINEGIMPVAYGYLPSFINKAEGDPVDILVFSRKDYTTGDTANVEILGMFTREDGDHKILAKDSSINYESFMDVPDLERKLLLEYFGYKSKITSVDDANAAQSYLNNPEMVSIA